MGHHGDYQACRDADAWDTYCRKDDPAPLTYGERAIRATRDGRRSGRDQRNDDWRNALSQPNFQSFLAEVERVDPFTFVTQFDRIVSFGRGRYRATAVTYTDPFPNSWLPNIQLDSWAVDNIVEWVPSPGIRPKSLILVGDSRLGKTAWARKHGHHIYFNGRWNMSKLDSISDDTKYVVWDDLSNWETFDYKQWLGGQWEFEVSGKYRAPKTVSGWGRPSIVCCNALPNHLDNQWVRDNALIVYIRFSLFQ